jgi:AcrR family transcriptional regulator
LDNVARNRRSILTAARKLLLQEPGRLSIQGVAREARVSASTICYHFESRTELLHELVADVQQRSDVEWLRTIWSWPDALDLVRLWINGVCQLWSIDEMVFRRLYAMRGLDTDADGALREKENDRYQTLGHLVQRLKTEGLVCGEYTSDELVRILGALTTFEMFQHLRFIQGLDQVDVAELLMKICTGLLASTPLRTSEHDQLPDRDRQDGEPGDNPRRLTGHNTPFYEAQPLSNPEQSDQ